MKYFKLFLFFYLSVQLNLKAQTEKKEFGKISKKEIESSSYAKDKSAEAVVLFDIGRSYFDRTQRSFQVGFEKTTRIKIFSEAGLEWGKIEILYYQEGGIYEKIYDIEAFTYNLEDGVLNKTALQVSNIYDEKINDYWYVKKFAMPNVKEGSIIEYKYKIHSPYMANLRDWNFQWKIPVVYSEYIVKMIPFYEYSYMLQGTSNFDFQTSYIKKGTYRQFGDVKFRDMVHRFVMKDVQAFKDEKFIASVNDYIIKIDFQLAKILYLNGDTKEYLSTWPDLINNFEIDDNFGEYVKKSRKLASKMINLDSLMHKPPNERFDFVMNYVKRNFNWNNNYGKYSSKTPNKFLKDKYGNCADINLFVTGLLQASGLEAYPLLISTRNHGKINYDYPYSHFFNYVLIYTNIDDKIILSDATEIMRPNNRIPTRCINGKGLVMNKANPGWVDLRGNIYSEKETRLSIDIKESKLLADIKKTATEHDAFYCWNVFGSNKEKLKDNLKENNYSVVDSSILIKNYFEINEPYKYEFKLVDNIEERVNKIYINPFLNEVIESNPLKQKTRTYPIDMIYLIKRTYSSTINIPDDYKVDFVPVNYNINDELFELNYSIVSQESTINIDFSYSFKNAVFSEKDYLRIKFYFNEIVKKGNEKVVFSKK